MVGLLNKIKPPNTTALKPKPPTVAGAGPREATGPGPAAAPVVAVAEQPAASAQAMTPEKAARIRALQAATGSTAPPPPPTAPATAPAAPPATTGTNDISRLVNEITQGDSPLIRSARIDGLKALNSRGLLNSSMAVGASEAEAFKAAVPIATNTATLQSNERTAPADRLAQLQTANRDRNARVNTADQDRAITEKLAKLDREQQKEIATWNVDAADRGRVADMVTAQNNTYEASLDAINKNKNLKAADRTAQINALNARRTAQFNMIRDLYDVDIDFS